MSKQPTIDGSSDPLNEEELKRALAYMYMKTVPVRQHMRALPRAPQLPQVPGPSSTTTPGPSKPALGGVFRHLRRCDQLELLEAMQMASSGLQQAWLEDLDMDDPSTVKEWEMRRTTYRVSEAAYAIKRHRSLCRSRPAPRRTQST